MDTPDRVLQLKAAIDHLEARRWRMAEVQCRIVLATNSGDIETTLVMALSIAASGEAMRAAPFLERVRRARPTHADPCRDLATMSPRVPRAIVTRQYRACLRLTPGNARLRHDFASYLLENGEPEAALTALRDAPESTTTLNLRGMALAETGKFREAGRCFDTAVRLEPTSAAAWANLAMMFKIEGRFDEAINAYDRAIAQDADDNQIRVNRAITLLHAGRWEEGWRDYEWRFQRPGFPRMSDAPLLPTVWPDTRLDNRKVLVWHEDGFGDSIQFARYLPMLTRLGARVTVSVPNPLVRLFAAIPGVTVARPGDHGPETHDYQCPLSSLARAFGTTPRDVPGAPYLIADPDLVTAWAARLPKDGLRTGLVWSGQARPWLHGFSSVDRRRSLGLTAFAPLTAVREACFVSLQTGTPAAQTQEPPPGMALTDPMEAVRDFADTAAIIANLDVVVSVDTSVAHLAGAMGKTVFLLDRYDNCWRWLHGRGDSPWYPSLTIFRQARPGDWAAVMQRVAIALGSQALFRGLPPDDQRALANAA
jgi:Tfp pilus assembly protein PilF